MTMNAMSNTYVSTGRITARDGFVVLCALRTLPVIIS